MKYTIIFLFAFLVSNIEAQGIEFFHGTWEETLAKAKEEEKLIFVDAYTTWCGPCKRMAKNVFTQEEVGDEFNAKFINSKMDMEKEENMSFIKNYPVSAYPTLFFINGEGEVVHKSVGGKDATTLLAFAAEAAKKDDKSVRYVDAYNKGDRDIELMINYVKALNDVDKPSLKISNEYLNSDPDITEEQRVQFLSVAVKEADSKLFDALVDKKELAIKSIGEESYNALIESACNATVKKAIEFEVFDLVNEAVNKYNSSSISPSKFYKSEAHLAFFSGTGRVEQYFAIAEKYLKEVKKKDEARLTNLLKTVSKKYKSHPEGEEILLSGYKSLSKNFKSWRNYVEYAKILSAFNKHKDALKYAEKALDSLSEEDDKKYRNSIETLIKQIKTQNIG